MKKCFFYKIETQQGRSILELLAVIAILCILTIGGVALGFIINKDGKGTGAHMIVIYAVALILMVLLFVKSFMDARRIPKQKEELNKRMLHRYACPKCHYFFGFQPYDVIRTNLDACPKCKVKLKK